MNKTGDYEGLACAERIKGDIGLYCIYDSGAMCKFFAFKKAQSTILLSDRDGRVIQSKCFSDDDNLDSESWLENEDKWCQKWYAKLNRE